MRRRPARPAPRRTCSERAAHCPFMFTLLVEIPLRRAAESGHVGAGGYLGALGIRRAHIALEAIHDDDVFDPRPRRGCCGRACAAAISGAVPAIAAPEDVALLHEYLGNWKGTGTITGPKGNTETTACRLDLIDGNGDKINFRAAARCPAPR